MFLVLFGTGTLLARLLIVRLYAIRASVKQPNLKEISKAPVRIESGAFRWANGSFQLCACDRATM